MKVSRILVACLMVAAAPPVMAGALVAPAAVSPGEADRLVSIESRCPTFSWGAVEGAEGYELLIQAGFKHEESSWSGYRRVIDGAATSWTPALDACLTRGQQYAWAVRALKADVPGPWSGISLFRVAPGPVKEEVTAEAQLRSRSLDASGSSEVGRSSGRAALPGPGRREAISEMTAASGNLVDDVGAFSAPDSALLGAGSGAIVVEGAPVLTAESPVVVPAAAFTSDGLSLGGFFFNAGRIDGLAEEGDDCLKAPVDLPSGVRLVELAAVVRDNDAGQRIDLTLWRFNSTDTSGGVDVSTTPIKALHSEIANPDPTAQELTEPINSPNGVVVEPDDAFYLTTCLKTNNIGLYWVAVSFAWP